MTAPSLCQPRPDTEAVLAGLKDFQRHTSRYVLSRYFDPDSPTARMLVADEVGLGKTMVARGVIAGVINELWDDVERIDIVYVCSNLSIARQNVRRLNMVDSAVVDSVGRITMLPGRMHHLEGRKVNFVAFTPGTSLDVRNSGGQVQERAVVWHMLRNEFGLHRNPSGRYVELFRFSALDSTFRNEVRRHSRIEPGIQARFHALVEQRDADAPESMRDKLSRLAALAGRRERNRPRDFGSERTRFMGECRRLLAEACLDALEPDLVILDEFQRFPHLLQGSGEDGELARQLLNYPNVRSLLLSATPFRMYSTSRDSLEGDHRSDFDATMRFLLDDDIKSSALTEHLEKMRTALFSPDGLEAAAESKTAAESIMRQVLVRTERLASSADRDGMLTEIPADGMRLDSADVRDYVDSSRWLAQVRDTAHRHGQPTTALGGFFEYWRSTPYPLNVMTGYKMRQAIINAHEVDPVGLNATLPRKALLTPSNIEGYREIPPRNAKFRDLQKHTIGRGLWKLLWLPPSLPYSQPGGPYALIVGPLPTKQLVFSAWAMVPRAVSMLLSYDAERLAMGTTTEPYAKDASPRLVFTRSDGRLTGHPALATIYPYSVLADLGDPLAVARRLNAPLPVAASHLKEAVRGEVSKALRPLIDEARTSGPVDESWYWAAGILLDRNDGVSTLSATTFTANKDESDSALAEHLDLWAIISLEELGRPPDDLADVLAEMALAAPGVCAQRALRRVTGASHSEVARPAAQVAWGLRSLFNRREALALLGREGSPLPYWRRVLEYCLDGNLQSVLDEHAHVLRDARGVATAEPQVAAEAVAEAMAAALNVRTTGVRIDDPTRMEHAGENRLSVRTHFAARFGDDAGSEQEKSVQRADNVQEAFNSPFWPFVLVSTSVGQEGLDFHWWCHSVVHWNLPSNPVDLEQREGRVHRYKGLAVRRNLAIAFGSEAHKAGCPDPWQRLFAAGVEQRPNDQDDLVPFWVFTHPDGVRVERHVPALPLSKESERLCELHGAVGAYRMTLGQPRQDDLLAFLGQHHSVKEISAISERLTFDLRPPATRATVVLKEHGAEALSPVDADQALAEG